MNNFYIYLHLRDVDDEDGLKGSVYYLGKGKDRRAFSRDRKHPIPKDKTDVVFLMTDMSEDDAYTIEEVLICWVGRKVIGTGGLLNTHPGGRLGSSKPSGRKGKQSPLKGRPNLKLRGRPSPLRGRESPMKGKPNGRKGRPSPLKGRPSGRKGVSNTKLIGRPSSNKGRKLPPRTPEHIAKIVAARAPGRAIKKKLRSNR